jgi:hypothetical protein
VDTVGHEDRPGEVGGGGTKDGEGLHLLELWSDRPEVHVVPELLRPAEGVVTITSGTLLRSGRLAQSRWLVVLTDRRLLCIKGRATATRKVIEMPICAIRSVQRTGVLRSTLALDTGYGTLRITDMKKHAATELTQGLTTLMRSFSEEGHGEGAAGASIPKADLSRLHGTETDRRLQKLETAVAELRDRVELLEGAGAAIR